LNFVHAVDTMSALIPVPEGSLIDTAPLLEHLAQEAQILCDSAVERARKRDRAATSTVVEGPAAEAIVRFAADADADTIVVGTRARTGLARLINGSVAEAIVRTSPVPVVVTHADDIERTGPIAVAVDDSEPSRAAFRFALDGARHSRQNLRLIHVRSANESYVMPVFVALLCREAADAGVALETSVVDGAIADGIVAAADAHNCSSIVMGTHGRNALQRIVQHSIAYTVVETAKVPVTVVRAVPDSEKIRLTARPPRSVYGDDFSALPISM
jgi:nucleotide-binding universal stress UspA family protein